MRFPGLAPWAGMRCPVGASRTMTFRSRAHAPTGNPVPLGWYALPRWGKWNDGVSIPCALPLGITFHWAGMRCPVGANGTMVFRSRAHSHWESRSIGLVCVAPLGQMERWRFDPVRISHWESRSIGLVCVAPLGQMERWCFDPVRTPTGNHVPLGWYALPRWGKWNDGVSDPMP
jgi:hypothetical protein